MISVNIKNRGEKTYAKVLEKENIDYIYQPKNSYLMHELHYTPDFYLIKKQCFVEIVGTRQAFHSNKEKITEAKNIVNLLVLTPNGKKYKSTNTNINTKISNKRRCLSFRPFDLEDFMLEYSLSVEEISELLGMNPANIYKIIERKTLSQDKIKIIKEYIKYNKDKKDSLGIKEFYEQKNKKGSISKYKRIYGLNIREMSESYNKPTSFFLKLHYMNKLRSYLETK